MEDIYMTDASYTKWQAKEGELIFKGNGFEILSYWDSTDHKHYQQGYQKNKRVYVWEWRELQADG